MYDEETGLYYLQTRYYKASQARFLNADCIIGSGYILTHNAYAYCHNNPVIFKDSQGTEPGDVFATEIEAVMDFVTVYGQLEDEYATNIFQLKNGKGYTYGKPVHGEPNTTTPRIPGFLEFFKYYYIADCHTHPMVAGAENMASIRVPSTNDLVILCQLDIQHIYIAVPDDGLLKISKSTSEPILGSSYSNEEMLSAILSLSAQVLSGPIFDLHGSDPMTVLELTTRTLDYYANLEKE